MRDLRYYVVTDSVEGSEPQGPMAYRQACDAAARLASQGLGAEVVTHDRVADHHQRLARLAETDRAVAQASYDESRRWLWTRIRSNDQEVLTALRSHGKALPAGCRRLPKRLDPVAVRRAALYAQGQPV